MTFNQALYDALVGNIKPQEPVSIKSPEIEILYRPTKRDVLASFLNTQNEDVVEVCDNQYNTPKGEYLVLEETEADLCAKEYIKHSVWAFNADFVARMTGLDRRIFIALQNQYEDSNEQVLKLIDQTCGIDDFVFNAISEDGRGHFIGGYDGKEHFYGDYYIYKLN